MKSLTKDLLTVAKFAAKDEGRERITKVYIDDEKMIATDSYLLLQVKHTGYEQKDWPKFDENTKPVIKLEKPILLSADIIKKSVRLNKRAELPVYGDAFLTNETEKTVSITTTDGQTTNKIDLTKDDGSEYPNVSEMMDKWTKDKPKVSITLNAEYMEKLMKAFRTEGISAVVIKVYDKNKPIVVIGNEKANENKTGMLMPIRS